MVALVALLWLAIRLPTPPKDAAAELSAPGAKPPVAEPLVFARIAPEAARGINERIPFAALGKSARGFALAGEPASRSRAIDCLAAAMWYEAGDDEKGNLSVGQVVLNRVRHPAYPGTVCGVVFQGSERSTGCQFTFTCDGAMRRQPAPATMDRLRARAARLLGGEVDRSVGLATHYHTDWVHPVWSAQMEKIARVHTHLFLRWKGAWGSAKAFSRRYGGNEPNIARLAAISPAHLAVPGDLSGDDANAALAGIPDLAPGGKAALDAVSGKVRFALSPQRNANVQAMVALDLCEDRAACEIVGVLEGGGANAPVVFHYERDRAKNIERSRWDCRKFKRPVISHCMPGTAPKEPPGQPL